MSGTPLLVKYNGDYYFPMLQFHSVNEFGMTAFGEPDYRELKQQFAEAGSGNWVLMPPYPYGPNESLLDLAAPPPNPPSREHSFGTDDRGRDVFVRLAYGFNVSLTFAIVVMMFARVVGVDDRRHARLFRRQARHPGAADHRNLVVAAVSLHHHHHQLDRRPRIRAGQDARFSSRRSGCWCSSSRSFEWVSITYYIRGEFYREKAKDYVGAAIATGVSEPKIMFRHILPNALTPVVSFAPFVIVANISIARRARLSGVRAAGADAKLGRADRPGHARI